MFAQVAATVAASQAAAQAESAAAQAASGMSTVMASDPMQLAKTATERAAAAAERLNSGMTTEDLLGMGTPVKAAATATATATAAATPSASSDTVPARADGRLLNDAVARYLGAPPGRSSAAQLVALLEAARPADAAGGAGAHGEEHSEELAAVREKARAKMTAMAEQHAALQQVREPA